MTRAERLKRLAALEAKLNVRPKPRCYVRCANDGAWLGDGPPGGELGPADRLVEIVFVEPDGTLTPPGQLAAACEACRPEAAP